MIKKENRKRCEGCYGIEKNLSLCKTFVNYLVDRSFATKCFSMKHETLLLLRTWFIQ